MSTYEAAYKSLLQGVSQQTPEERLPGQLSSQTNMLSDPVTNLRRRPGLQYETAWAWTSVTGSSVIGTFTDLAGARVHVLLNTATGQVKVLNELYALEATLEGGAYLQNADPSRIRVASVGNEMFFCNLDVAPTLQYTSTDQNSGKAGFFYIIAGAYSKSYSVAVVSGASTWSASYTTPSGAGAGDAALSTPEYIAEQLRAQLAAFGTVTVTRDGPYVFVQYTAALAVNSGTGTNYMIASNAGFVSAVGNLPARLPGVGDTFVCRVGTGVAAQFYKYVHAKTEWQEAGAYGSPTGITNAPVSLYWTGTAWAINTTAFFGRNAGDDVTNPAHEWMSLGLSGMGTFQGRLVLLSGPMVALSEAGQPRQFFRTTVTNVLNSDPIEVGAGMNSAAAYEWAVPFNKDLVLFSKMYQAVLPSGNQAVTPSTATVIPTSAHETDTRSSPIALGRTLMYCTPKSVSFFGAMEMVPSSYTDSQYLSQDATPHLPKYMAGRCRFAVSSSVANIALFAPTGDTHSLLVHEYHWDGDNKVQQSWHQWLFPYPVATAYFASDKIVLVFVNNGSTVLLTIDPRAGSFRSTGERLPFLDGNGQTTIVNHVVNIPAWMLAFDPLIASKLKLMVVTGPLTGELVGATPSVDGTQLITVASHPSGTVGVGIPYYSGFSPSPPVVRDYKEEVIHSGKATLNRYMIGTRGSSEFTVNVGDEYMGGEDFIIPTLTFSSPELTLGRGLYSDSAVSIVPCRTDMRSTAIEVFTQGTGELNITSLEYVAKYHPKIKRR